MNVKDIINSDNVTTESYDGIEQNQNVNHGSSKGLSFLKVPCVDKPIDEYLNHPLNIKHDEDLGQGLRGIEAFLGNTNLAIIDLFGFVKYLFKNRSVKEEVKNVENPKQFIR